MPVNIAFIFGLGLGRLHSLIAKRMLILAQIRCRNLHLFTCFFLWVSFSEIAFARHEPFQKCGECGRQCTDAAVPPPVCGAAGAPGPGWGAWSLARRRRQQWALMPAAEQQQPQQP